MKTIIAIVLTIFVIVALVCWVIIIACLINPWIRVKFELNKLKLYSNTLMVSGIVLSVLYIVISSIVLKAIVFDNVFFTAIGLAISIGQRLIVIKIFEKSEPEED